MFLRYMGWGMLQPSTERYSCFALLLFYCYQQNNADGGKMTRSNKIVMPFKSHSTNNNMSATLQQDQR